MHIYTCTHTLAYAREPIYKHIHMYTCHTRTHIRTCTHIHMHRNIYTNTCKWQADPNAKGGLMTVCIQGIQESLLQLYLCTSYTHYLLCVPATVQSSPWHMEIPKIYLEGDISGEKINSHTIHNHSHIGTYSRHMYFHIHTCINAHSYACIHYMNNVNNFH